MINDRNHNYSQLALVLAMTAVILISACTEEEKPSNNSNTWTELGNLNANDRINSICTDGINVYAAGNFTDNTGKYVAKWDGSNWTALGDFRSSEMINALYADSLGNVYADAYYQQQSTYYRYVAKWDGSQWHNLGNIHLNGAIGPINTIFSDKDGNVYAAGGFTNGTSYFVAKWDGNNWSEVGNLDANGPINVIKVDANGYVTAAGDFTNPDGKCYVAIWNGNTWANSMMLTEHAPGGSVYALERDNIGNFYAGGSFSYPNANPGEPYFLAWNHGPQSIAAKVNDQIYTLTTNGTYIHAAGSFSMSSGGAVGKWDVSKNSWTELGALNANNRILSMCTDDAGNIYAAGEFTNGNGNPYVAVFRK